MEELLETLVRTKYALENFMTQKDRLILVNDIEKLLHDYHYMRPLTNSEKE